MENNILLSIVVPVYNTSSFLEDCLESIERISVSKEIICIDDGSTDKSLEFLTQMAEKYSDICVYSQENSGVSVARNFGIDKATGKYICFFDSDDAVNAKVIDIAIGLMEQECLDVVSFSKRTISENENYLSVLPFEKYTLEKNCDLSVFVNRTYAWQKIINRALICDNNLRFPPIKIFEDAYFMLSVCCHTKKYLNINLNGYFYRERLSSAMHGRDKYLPWFNGGIVVAKFIKEISPNVTKKKLLKLLKNQYNLFVLHSMTAGLYINIHSGKTIIDELRHNGLYPVKPFWRLLRIQKSCKHTLVNWSRFFFFSKHYYCLFLKMFRIFNQK